MCDTSLWLARCSIVFTLQIETTDKADAAAAQLYNLARESCKVFFAVSITTATDAVLKECVQIHAHLYIISSLLARHRADSSIAKNGSQFDCFAGHETVSETRKDTDALVHLNLFMLFKYLLCNWTPSLALRAPSETRWLIWKCVCEKVHQRCWCARLEAIQVRETFTSWRKNRLTPYYLVSAEIIRLSGSRHFNYFVVPHHWITTDTDKKTQHAKLIT